MDTVYYPKINEDRALYDACRRDNGGYGGLLSVTFKEPQHRHCDSSSGVSTTTTSKSTRADHPAATFYDTLTIAKGPSLGTNFTLACPYTILAHYTELPFAERCGISRWLVRVSVGLEEEEGLKKVFGEALREVERVWGNAPTAMPGE